jgi:hypothetical protein
MLLESAKLTTVGELEMSASLASIGIFDKLKSLGMDEAEATAVIEKLNAENARLAEERVVAAFAAMRVIYRNSVFAATAEGGGK